MTQAGNQKFIAAEPANNLILRLLVSQSLADLYEEAIARLMPVLVIDSLEIIEVNKGNLKWSTKTGHRVRVFPVSIFRFVWG